jgi:hypothetical protein
MVDEEDLLILADKCRSLATLAIDESTAGSLNRLADGYENQARVARYLANGRWSMDQGSDGRAPIWAPH